jgi:competence protein ComEA
MLLMKKINHWIRRYFGFSQREVNGFLGIILLLILLVGGPYIFRAMPDRYDPSTDQVLLDNLVAQMEAKRQTSLTAPPVVPVKLYNFDPNQVGEAEWQQMGVPRGVAQRIIKYRSKAGDYRYKSDLKKIYGLTDSLYQRLYPFIDLPSEKPARIAYESPSAKANTRRESDRERPVRARVAITRFDLNLADTLQLKQIRGIGSKLSARIVLFRERLGGFHQFDQISEVYGLPPEVVDSLRKYSFVQPGFSPDPISLNFYTVDQLRNHPYISLPIARAILAYRDQHGHYKQIEDIQNIKLMEKELFHKLRPYLSVD